MARLQDHWWPVGIVLLAALSFGGKCVAYDERLFPAPPPDAAVVPGGDSAGDSAGDGPAGFVPAIRCPNANEARFLVQDLAFVIQCGCREGSGKRCTVPRGTSVVWQFADSEEHNIVSLANQFGTSGGQLSGAFQHTFAAPGTNQYGCGLHPTVMRDYSIVVE